MPKVSICACILAVVSTAAGAQDSVTIETIVNNKSGFVKDLAAKDFKLWDDNKEQTVTAAAPRGAGKHVVVLLFDSTSLSVSHQSDIRGYVEKFIDAGANPNLFMEVASFRVGIEILQPFTSDPSLLKSALTGTAASSVVASVLTGATAGARGLGQGSIGDSQAGSDSTMKSQAMMENLRGLVENLASIRGRKAIIFFTGGQQFSQDAITQVDAAIDAANKANVAIYGVSDNVAYTKTFADATGGTTVRPTQSLPEALQQMVLEQDQYYAVTFTPSAGSADGGCHALKLRTDVDGTDVRARKSYCPEKQAGPQLDSALAGAAPGTLTASLQAPWFYGAADRARVKVVLDAPASGVKVRKEKGKLRAELNVAGAAYRPDGSVASHFSESLSLEFADKKQADAWLGRPFHYENQLDLPAGKYTVKAALSPAPNVFGKAATEITITPDDPQKLRVSAIALSWQLIKSTGGAAGLPADMIEGPTPLLAGGYQVVPTAITRFQKTDHVFFYTEIEEPSLAGKTPAGVSMQFRVLERASGALKSDSGVASVAGYIKPGNRVIAVASTVPTAQLAPGAYRFEMTISHTTGPETATRSVDFDIQ